MGTAMASGASHVRLGTPSSFSARRPPYCERGADGVAREAASAAGRGAAAPMSGWVRLPWLSVEDCGTVYSACFAMLTSALAGPSVLVTPPALYSVDEVLRSLFDPDIGPGL